MLSNHQSLDHAQRAVSQIGLYQLQKDIVQSQLLLFPVAGLLQ